MLVHNEILMNARMPVLAGHRVQGRHLLPGLAYIDLIFQLFQAHGHDPRHLMLRDLTIFAPIALLADEEVVLAIDWAPLLHDVAWSITIQGRLRSAHGDMAEPVRFATAEMHRTAEPASFDERLDLASLAASARSSLQLADLYATARERDLVHDDYMQVVGRAMVGDESFIVDASLGAEARVDAAQSLFHPALIDGCAVAFAGLMTQAETSTREAAKLFLPLHLGSFQASEWLQSRCHARLKKDAIRTSKELRFLTLEFFNGEGRKVAELRNLAAKEVRAPEPAQGEPPLRVPDGDPGVSRVSAVQDHVRGLLARRLNCEPSRIGLDAGYYELGLVSRHLMEVVQELSAKVGTAIAPTLLFEYANVRELAQYLADRHGDRFEETVDEPIPAATSPRPPPAPSPSTETRPSPGVAGEPIAIIGMAGRYPGAQDLDAFWHLLSEGRDAVSEVPAGRWDHADCFDAEKGVAGKSYARHGGFIDGVEGFDPMFFGIPPREAGLMDPQGRLFLETVWNLLESGGHTRESLRRRHGGAVGVYLGAMYQHYALADAPLNQRALAALGSYSAMVNRVSHFFGFEGPSLAIDTMCSSAAMAIHMACKDLRLGECGLAVVGGVNLSLDEKKYIGLSQLQIIASHADSRSFCEGDGYLPSEGVGAVLLKPLSLALADGDPVLAVITGSACQHSGHANAYMVPNPNAMAKAMADSLRQAGVSPGTVTFVEAAANGSPLGDPIEVAALVKAFGSSHEGRCALGAVKSNIGHPEAASGMAQLAKVVLQLQHRQLVPTLVTGSLNAQLGLEGTPFALQRDLAPWTHPAAEPRRALINSFAAGGSYVSLVVEEHLDPRPVAAAVPRPAGKPQLIVLSAKDLGRLRAVTERLLAHVRSQQHGLDLANLAYTLQCGREAMAVRLALVVRSQEELPSRLGDALSVLAGQADGVIASGIHWEDMHEAQSRGTHLRSGRAAEARIDDLVSGHDLGRLAASWVRGEEVPWEALDRGCAVRMVALPTYPFDRQRHWLDKVDASAASAISAQAVEGGDLQDLIAGVLADMLGARSDSLSLHRPFNELGLDSITGMRLCRRLSSQFGLDVTGRDLMECPSIDRLATRLSSRLDTRASIAQDSLLEALEQYQQGSLEIDDLKGVIDRAMTA